MSVLSYLLTFIGIIFWFFRAIVTLLFQLDRPFFATPLNVNIEIGVLFATLPCLIFVVKRNIVGAAAYFAIYGTYFGTALYNAIISANESGLNLINSMDMLCTLMGVLIPLLTFLDILFNKNRKGG